MMHWYVIQAYSGFEMQVMKSIKECIERLGLQDKFGEVLVPTEEVVEVKDGQKRKSERKFFPGYVLVQMEMDEAAWHAVKNTPRVIGFVGGTSDKPRAISDKEADLILRRVRIAEEGPRLKVLYDVGEMVRVNDGPFNDFNGVVEEIMPEKGRLRVAVMIFGRSTPVELEFAQVEKI